MTGGAFGLRLGVVMAGVGDGVCAPTRRGGGITIFRYEWGAFITTFFVVGSAGGCFSVADSGGDDLLSVTGGVDVNVCYRRCETCLPTTISLVFLSRPGDGVRIGRDTSYNIGGENFFDVATIIFGGVVDVTG